MKWPLALAAVFAVYLPAGYFISRSYVPPETMQHTVSRPFAKVEPGKYLALEEFHIPRWVTPQQAEATPITLILDGRPVGTGRWKLGVGVIISRYDGGNPNDGEVKYYLTMPPFINREYKW